MGDLSDDMLHKTPLTYVKIYCWWMDLTECEINTF